MLCCSGSPGRRSGSTASASARSGRGLLILLGVGPADDEFVAAGLAAKVAGLRIFADAEGLTNLSIGEVGGAALVVSQFTLYADTRRGRRPSFIGAAGPIVGERLYEVFCEILASDRRPRARRAASGRRWRSSWSTTGRSRSGSTATSSASTPNVGVAGRCRRQAQIGAEPGPAPTPSDGAYRRPDGPAWSTERPRERVRWQRVQTRAFTGLAVRPGSSPAGGWGGSGGGRGPGSSRTTAG